jgi:aryl-alcohol dehydrogenase-like predicted oxidoreductase
MGTSGIQVSSLCFGTMSFGGDADKDESRAMFNDCLDAGINVFDCANVYQKGIAEEYLGEFAAPRRKDLILTTKAYFPMSDGVNDRGSSRRNIFLSVRDSLRRLKTDYIDVLFLHKFDDSADLAESLEALTDLRRKGDILYLGLSNFAAWQIEKAIGIAALNRLISPTCVQPMYSLVKRQAEVEILPMAAYEKLGVFSYSPVGGGLLSGKFSRESRPEGTRMSDNEMYVRRYGDQRYWVAAEEFTALSREWGVHPVTLAVSWVRNNPAVTAPIIGARNTQQLQASLAAAEYRIEPELGKALERISPAPPPATDRSEERESFGYERMLR